MIIFLEDSEDLRELMSELIRNRWGLECRTYASYDELVAAGDDVLTARLALLDINLGDNRKSGIDALNWLRERGFAGRICFLTGHGRLHPLVASASVSDVEVLAKPLKVSELELIIFEMFPEMRKAP